MSNPWKDIDLSDYENHMSLDNVRQLQTLDRMMKEQFYCHVADPVMILGIAGGNGLEHIDPEKISCVYGVDINRKYLNECAKRYSYLGNTFKPVCADLSDNDPELPHAELLIADLVIEYIGYKCFQNVVRKADPGYVSCVIQINTDTSFVSDSPYLHAFDRLDEVHHQMQESELVGSMREIGYEHESTDEKELPNGKKLVRLDFYKL